MTFALDPVWPPGFRSRTCDPADVCFIGAVGKEANRSHAPAPGALESFAGKGSKAMPHTATRMKSATRAWRIYNLIKAAGPMRTSEICRALDLLSPEVINASKRLLDTDILRVQRGSTGKREMTFSLGATKVVEVAA